MPFMNERYDYSLFRGLPVPSDHLRMVLLSELPTKIQRGLNVLIFLL